MLLGEPSRSTKTADGWLQAADAAMYESKMAGRNRVTVRQPDAAGRNAVA
jgi:PleD family two-component response regulator